MGVRTLLLLAYASAICAYALAAGNGNGNGAYNIGTSLSVLWDGPEEIKLGGGRMSRVLLAWPRYERTAWRLWSETRAALLSSREHRLEERSRW